MNLQGCGTALITPFRPDGSVDEAALHAHVQWQVTNGVSLLVPCGTTGEAAARAQRRFILIDSSADAVKVMAQRLAFAAPLRFGF